MSTELSNDALKAQVAAQYTKTELKFPTEIIDLPSKGLLYPEGHPLRSGMVEMKYMTAREEDILSTPSLIKKGIVLDKLFESLIISNGEGVSFNYRDLVLGDKNAIMVASRVLGYGKLYGVSIIIPKLDDPHEVEIDLTTLKDKEFDEDLFTEHGNNVPFLLPNSNKQITFKILDGHAEAAIKSDLTRQAKKNTSGIERTNSTRMKHIITSVDGDDSRSTINDFVDTYLLSSDSILLKEYIQKIQPDVDLRIKVEIEDEEISEFFDIPIGIDFFWPGA